MQRNAKKLLIIGGGNMGFAIASGIIKKGAYDKSSIIFLEKKQERINFLKKERFFVFNDLDTIKKISKNLNVVIVAVKPNDVNKTLVKLKDKHFIETPIISIVAGVKLQRLSQLLLKNQPIVRVMPNTPCQIGEGMSVVTFNKKVTKLQKKNIVSIFEVLGKVLELKENKFDIVTAISGSGPAYFCYLIECLIDSAKKLGTTSKIAQELVLQTALGTITLLSKNNLNPKTLREYVTSPKGTTEAALKVFQKEHFSNIIHSAIKAAKNRSAQFFSLFLCLFTSLLISSSYAQEPIQLSTEAEDIALTDDINVARAQVAKYPNNPEAHFNLAIALSRTSLVENAIKELRQTKILIRKTENKGTIEKKINEYKEMIKNNPGANNIRYRLAFSYYLKAYLLAKNIEKLEKNKLKDSQKNKDPIKVNLFESKALSLSEKNPLIKESLGLSIFYFKELLSSNPDDVWAKVYYAFILAEQFGEITKAKELWIDALKQDPNNPAPHFFLGELHIKEGNLKEGILEISQALLLRSEGH